MCGFLEPPDTMTQSHDARNRQIYDGETLSDAGISSRCIHETSGDWLWSSWSLAEGRRLHHKPSWPTDRPGAGKLAPVARRNTANLQPYNTDR